jgi:hypothetical protein
MVSIGLINARFIAKTAKFGDMSQSATHGHQTTALETCVPTGTCSLDQSVNRRLDR